MKFPEVLLVILVLFSSWIDASLVQAQTISKKSTAVGRFPKNKAKSVNPDTHLKLTFQSTPVVGNSGEVRIYDASNNHLVDSLDLSIPAGPTVKAKNPFATYTPIPYFYSSNHFTNSNTKPGTPSGDALPATQYFQLNIIGGFTDGFHFYPVLVHNKSVTIYPHNNVLQYNKTYYVQVDPGVLHLKKGSFNGISGKSWTFSTKEHPPPTDSKRLVVNADGRGDFNTIQGALDFVPENDPKPVTIYVKNGKYEEIVYCRNKKNVTIRGESRDSVIIYYPNNETFNPHPWNLKTNEWAGTFPKRRAVVAFDHCNRIHLANLTIKNTTPRGQAEALLMDGKENIVSNVTINGSGDALQSNGSTYYSHCHIIGDGDTILGRGPDFFKDCLLNSYGSFMWIRNSSLNHGNVFVDCTFKTLGSHKTVIARAPVNHGQGYPFAEAVLIDCSLAGITPKGWGPVGNNTSDMRFWEYNSTHLGSKKPVDVSQRIDASRQLTLPRDSEIIANYQKTSYVLGGWNPKMNTWVSLPSKSASESVDVHDTIPSIKNLSGKEPQISNTVLKKFAELSKSMQDIQQKAHQDFIKSVRKAGMNPQRFRMIEINQYYKSVDSVRVSSRQRKIVQSIRGELSTMDKQLRDKINLLFPKYDFSKKHYLEIVGELRTDKKLAKHLQKIASSI